MKIALGTDHAGFALKEVIREFLEAEGHEVQDFGAYEFDKKDDYPDFVLPAAWAVVDGNAERAVVFGSSGNGEATAANRIKGIRATVYYGNVPPLDNTAKAGELRGIIHEAREDNDANILSIGASFVSEEEAKGVVKEWLETPFTGKERHLRRIGKLDQ